MVSQAMILTDAFERLNALAKIVSASRYLEIGVAKGHTFRKVNVQFKVAVDPRFRLDIDSIANSSTVFHEVTSDEFFESLASKYQLFDLIYLDGMHTFEQTLRDFTASIPFSHARTIWLLDDTCPSSWLAANPNRQFTDRFRGRFRLSDRNWMGDVYKVVFAIHDFFPQFNYATFPGHGQTVVWLETRNNFTPTWNSMEKISRMNYLHFLRFRESHMKFAQGPEILNVINSSLNARVSVATHSR